MKAKGAVYLVMGVLLASPAFASGGAVTGPASGQGAGTNTGSGNVTNGAGTGTNPGSGVESGAASSAQGSTAVPDSTRNNGGHDAEAAKRDEAKEGVGDHSPSAPSP